MRLIDFLDYPALRYAPVSNNDLLEKSLSGSSLPCGQYAFAIRRENSVYLVRDPLGCNKLFLGRDREGDLIVANRIHRIWQYGVPLSGVASCPPGHVLEISDRGARQVAGSDIFESPADPTFDIAKFQQDVRETLARAFAWLAHELADFQFVVCLSGGLDSSIIASFAAAYLPNVHAASFTYLDADDLRRYALGTPVEQLATASEDFRCAARVASTLEMPLVVAVRPRQAVAGAIRASVQLCQDWRDFNVHCATVNLFLAQDIRAALPGRKVAVLTGDLMNEYVCDYSEERVGSAVYYRIPRIPTDRKRKYFVRGLDAGDREVGVFWSYGLIACQPFALVADHYMRVPPAILDEPNAKWTLNGPLVAPRAAFRVNKSKSRAQVGGPDLGTLGIYHQLGLGEADLRRVWQDQFPGEPATSTDDLIAFGRYRMSSYKAGR